MPACDAEPQGLRGLQAAARSAHPRGGVILGFRAAGTTDGPVADAGARSCWLISDGLGPSASSLWSTIGRSDRKRWARRPTPMLRPAAAATARRTAVVRRMLIGTFRSVRAGILPLSDTALKHR
jgi:hypothetical protein